MATLSQWILQELNKISIQLQELCLTFTYSSIKCKYDKDIHAWEYFEESCEEWYMDLSNFWDDNYFQLLFDEIRENVMPTSLQLISSLVEVLVSFSPYEDDFLDWDGYIYVDPHDRVGHLEHMTQLSITPSVPQLGGHINIWAWDPGLGVSSLSYFNVAVNLCILNLGFLDYNNGFNIRTWDPGSWLYIFMEGVEGNTFLRVVECYDPLYGSNRGAKGP